jgi:hypothetical protein
VLCLETSHPHLSSVLHRERFAASVLYRLQDQVKPLVKLIKSIFSLLDLIAWLPVRCKRYCHTFYAVRKGRDWRTSKPPVVTRQRLYIRVTYLKT